MRIAIYSGSFNPIHTGHIRLAEHILSHTDTEELWFVVSPNNPLKNPKTLTDEKKRLRWVESAIEDYERETGKKSRMAASDVELDLPRPSFTVNTLRYLTGRYPQHQFSLVIGSDNMARFDQWREWEYILQHYPIIVYPRTGDNLTALQQQYPQMQVLKDAPLFDISATMIREKVAKGEDISEFVAPSVEKELKNTNNSPLINH
ncbi:MAG: nicotinate-nucleotide adenylyltransferase [Bacteroidales bacterium]|nr:nicotinate-nucleotide adenylyltransferase [Bacteroidales bacterium]